CSASSKPAECSSRERAPRRPLLLTRLAEHYVYCQRGADVKTQMSFRLAFGGDPQDLVIPLSGRADPAGLSRLDDELRADPRFKPGLAILVDLSELDASGLTSEVLAETTERVLQRDWFAQPLAVAIVAPDPQTFATAALYRAHLGGTRSRRRVFTNAADATTWLREQRRVN